MLSESRVPYISTVPNFSCFCDKIILSCYSFVSDHFLFVIPDTNDVSLPRIDGFPKTKILDF